MTLNVLLTDTNRWPAPARLAIGLAKAGCDVSAVCVGGHPLHKTSVVRRTFGYSGFRPLRSLVTAIDAVQPHIIIPCDDRGVQHLHELYAQSRRQGSSGDSIANLIERSLGAPESYPIVSSRNDLLQIAREEGLRVPDSCQINSIEDLKPWQEKEKAPWVLKVDGTFGGRGVRIAHTPEDARASFLEITSLFATKRVFKRLIVNRDPFWIGPWWNRSTPPVIMQAHIDGRPANCGVVCWEGKVLAGFGVEVVTAEDLTSPAAIVRVVDNPEMMLAAERIARRLKLSGFFGLDFMIENGSGAAYLIEMNPRSTPLCHLQLGKGRDMIGALWAQLSGQPLRETAPVTENDLIAYFPQAWACKSELMQASFQDIPEGEPGLVQELLRPWPDRSLLNRVASKMTFLRTLPKRAVANALGTTGAPTTFSSEDSASKPLVSILIPAFNAEESIAGTIRSALAQTWRRKEIIVVDDGSSDRTLAIAQQFESNSVRVVAQKNQGAAVARNTAFSLSQGEYIQWLDADDLLAPDKVASQMEALGQNPNKRMLCSSGFGRFKYRPYRTKFIPTALWCDLSPVEWLLRKMGQNVYMQTGVWLVSRELTEAAGPWDSSLLGDDDGEYFCRVLLASEGVRFVPQAKMYYRAPWLGTLSYLGRSENKLNALWKSMRLHIVYLRSLEDSERVRAACLKYLHASLLNFYPEMTDIVSQVQQMALELGGEMCPPRLSWKYSWALKVFGWGPAKRLQGSLQRTRWHFSAAWDEILFRLERRFLPNAVLYQSGPVEVWSNQTTEAEQTSFNN